MDEIEKEPIDPNIILGAAVITAGAVWYALTTRKERKKRKKIQEWETMNLNALIASTNHLSRILEDPCTTHSQFRKAWKEENAFLKLINDQPKY